MSDGTCPVPGCTRSSKRARGLCSMHAERKRLHGEVGPAESKRPGPRPCSVEGCNGTTANGARGWCGNHYQAWRKHGDPLVNLRPGRTVLSVGYWAVMEPGHPLAMADGYVLEHRKVVYDAGIPVPPGYHVHHINGDKLDNRLENLEVKRAGDHGREHAEERGYVVNQFGKFPVKPRGQRGSDLYPSQGAVRPPRFCSSCGEPLPARKRIDALYCGKRCQEAAWRDRRSVEQP